MIHMRIDFLLFAMLELYVCCMHEELVATHKTLGSHQTITIVSRFEYNMIDYFAICNA